jgi:hypothetical protein
VTIPWEMTGWVHNPDEVGRICGTLPRPLFGATAAGLKGSGAGRTTLLYKAWKDVNGQYIDYPAQVIGCCVSRGFEHGVDLLECVQIALGHKAEKFTPTSHEFIYATARVDVGGQRGSYQDGAVGAWAAKAVSTLGTVSQELVGPYDDRKCKEWGARGAPADLKAKAADHKVHTVSLVTTFEELEDALANGYPVTVCSNQGFTLERDEHGFCRPHGNWSHCLLPGTLVSTEVPKPIEDLQVGDLVTSHDGDLHGVTELFRRPYNGDIIAIDCVGTTTVRYTTEHPLLVSRPDCGSPRWISAVGVRPGDRLLTPIIRQPTGDGLPAWERSDGKNQPADITGYDRSLAWMFGYYIANGNRRLGHGISFTIPMRKAPIADRLADIFANLGLTAKVTDHDSYRRVRVDSVTVERSFCSWFGDGSFTKRIPPFLFRGWDLESVLKGIYDGDGGTRANGLVYFDTISPVLARQVWQIQVMLGRHVMMNRTRADRPGAYENAKAGFRVGHLPARRQRPRTEFIEGFYAMPVRSVTRTAYVGDVYNCEVAETHSYLADGVVSHNCMLIVGTRSDPKPGACIFQSWGANVPSGPLDLDQPDNSFWADRDVVARMLGLQDSWALSSFDGYPGQALPSDWTYQGFS